MLLKLFASNGRFDLREIARRNLPKYVQSGMALRQMNAVTRSAYDSRIADAIFPKGKLNALKNIQNKR
jgi:hypothetical protein